MAVKEYRDYEVNYQDTGCRISILCRLCPLSKCLDDRGFSKKQATLELIALGWNICEIAKALRIDEERVMQYANGGNECK